MAVLEEVKQILADVLQIDDRVEALTEDSPLLGAIPELDSMAVVSIITAIEDNYGVVVEDDEIDAGVFETLGSLVCFVESKTTQ
jgi:acyl carrier protein